MPNYIYNRLILECDKPSILDQFYEENRYQDQQQITKFGFHDETVLSFSCQVPINTGEDIIEKWGCKWDASSPKYTRLSPTKSEYCFTTPWGAPIVWLLRVSKKYSEISFTIRYECEGLSFVGTQIVSNGVSRSLFEYRLADIPVYFKNELKINLANLYNLITIKSRDDILALEVDEEGNNNILDGIIQELGLNKEFSQVKAWVIRDIYMALLEKLDIGYLEQYK
jgi:hypothetical protein